mgnify:CR=1 FL=1
MKIEEQKELIHLEICEDCYLYVANGDVPKEVENADAK